MCQRKDMGAVNVVRKYTEEFQEVIVLYVDKKRKAQS